jgi:hypothetical protein
MRRFLHILLAMLFTITLISATTSSASASAEDNEHAMKMEVNGYHVTLESQNEWKKGEDTIVVTLMDSMGVPVENADVEIMIASTADDHSGSESTHGAEEQHDSMSGTDMGEDTSHESMPGMDMSESVAPASRMPEHDEQSIEALAMTQSDEYGMYTLQTHFESSGEHEVSVMFHVNGEMLQATFVVDILSSLSKSLVLWGFVAVNVVLMTSAGLLKKQTVAGKGR